VASKWLASDRQEAGRAGAVVAIAEMVAAAVVVAVPRSRSERLLQKKADECS